MKHQTESKSSPYRILLVFSYVKKCDWTQKQYEGVINCLKEHDIDAKVDSFHMDGDILGKEWEIDTLNRLLNKYVNTPPDLIITCDDQATYSLQATAHPLTYKVPIVFCGVDYVNQEIMKDRTNITGFTTKPDYLKCYNLARQLFGDIKWFHVITEPNYLGRMEVVEICKQLKVLPNLGKVVEIKKVNEHLDIQYDTLFVNKAVSEDAFNIRMLRLDMMTIRVMKWAFIDQPGVVFLMPRWSSIHSGVSRTDNLPFLMVNNEGFGDGRLGGYMTESYDQTYQATETGIRILQGADPNTFPIQLSKSVPTFDWRQLDHWKISLDKLPPDSVIINMPFLMKYRTVIWGTGIGLGVFIGIILLMLDQLYRREKSYKKRFQKTLIKEQSELNITMESIRDGVILIDNNRKIRTINRSALNWLELGSKEVDCMGKSLQTMLDIRLVNNSGYLNNLLERVTLTGNYYVLDPSAYLVTPEGLSFPISGSITSIRFDDGRQGMIIVFRNIVKEMAQKEFLDLCITAGDVFVWKYDQKKRLFIYDNAFFNILHWQESENGALTLDSFQSFLHPDDHSKWEDAMQIMSGGQQLYHNIQVRLQTGKGVYSWWEYRILSEPNRVSDENYTFFGLALNIDYLKKKEKELEDIRDKAQEADRQKTIFLSNMSHEIRTPLNAIVGFSELLIDSEDLTADDQQEFITIINKNCNLLLNLVNDILDISRIESGIVFKREPCELNALVLDIVEAHRDNAVEDVSVLAELPERSHTIWSDNFRIRQILNNLLSNAIKFTTKGSVIVGYQSDEENSQIHFFVRDTGCGISLQEQDKIFERFYKSDDFTQGGGLGLPICNEIISRMHGRIILESELGKGTCFHVLLPDLSDDIDENNGEIIVS